MLDETRGKRRVRAYVALATTVEVAHVGYVNFEGTLYFLCGLQVYMDGTYR
jgi:hypothetical protein